MFLLAAAALAAGLVLALRVRLRERRNVGDVIQHVTPGLRGRLVATLAVAAVIVLAVVKREDVPLTWSLALLNGTLLFLWLRPSAEDRVCGTEGVRVGWSVRSLAELEEWRLTGDHLRFRLHGEWTAVELANEHHADVGARLRAAIPDRESAFK
ncbi:MAG: hypothetical protein O7B99_14950 [Planctomycetota bacterium]|nr:hypothetical protein [Planctomycetota bacterium]